MGPGYSEKEDTATSFKYAPQCREELNQFLSSNGYGDYFAFSKPKWGVCSGFRCECEFSLHVDDRFAIEMHAFELRKPWKREESPDVRRYIGVFFFASDIQETQISPTVPSETKKNNEEPFKYLSPRYLREALVRPPQHMLRPEYRLVRLSPHSSNYGLEAFNALPYIYPGKEGQCIHAAIFVATLLTSQWAIPIPPLETTFHLSQIVQQKVWMQSEIFDEILQMIRDEDLGNDLENDFYSYFECLYKGLQIPPGKKYASRRNEFQKLFDDKGQSIHEIIRDAINDRLDKRQKSKTSPDEKSEVLKHMKRSDRFLFPAIQKTQTALFELAAEVDAKRRPESRGDPFAKQYDYLLNVHGMSVNAAIDIINSSKTTSATAVLERLLPDLYPNSNPSYRYNQWKILFHQIIQCYLNERIPVIVPVNHDAFHDPGKDSEEVDIDHAVTVVGYRPNPTLEEPAFHYVTVDIHKEGLYKECPFNVLFDAAVRYDRESGKNLISGTSELPPLHLLTCMPRNFTASFVTVFKQFNHQFPVLCHCKRLIPYLRVRLKKLREDDVKYIQRLSLPDYLWLVIKEWTPEVYQVKIVIPYEYAIDQCPHVLPYPDIDSRILIYHTNAVILQNVANPPGE